MTTLTVSKEFSAWLDREVAKTLIGTDINAFTLHDKEKSNDLGYRAAERLMRDLRQRGIYNPDNDEMQALLTTELAKRLLN